MADHFYCWFLSMVAHWWKPDRMYANSLVPVCLRSGERYWLNTQEEEELTDSNESFRQQPLEMQYLFSYFRLPSTEEEGEKYTAVQLLDQICARSKRKFSNTSSVSFGRMLNASEIPKIHTKMGNFYLLVKL